MKRSTLLWMPYRIDISDPPQNTLDILVELGALDIDRLEHGIAAILPDEVTRDRVACALGVSHVSVSPAVAQDNGSVWLLSPRAVRIGSVLISSPEAAAKRNTLRLTNSPAFGTGHHPTTAMCIEALQSILTSEDLDSVLDVGTGSGILALSALLLKVPRAVGLDTDSEALRAAADNARVNNLSDRLQLVLGGPGAVRGTWPLVLANVLAAPLIEMAPVLVRRVGKRGTLILSGIPWSLDLEVKRTYQRLGLRSIDSTTRGGWTMLMFRSSW